MNSEVFTEWADDHKEKSSENYDPYDYIYEQEYYDEPVVEMIDEFDWEHDE